MIAFLEGEPWSEWRMDFVYRNMKGRSALEIKLLVLKDVFVITTHLKELKLEVTRCAIPLRLMEEESRNEG
jgi:hypothetical protein